MVSVLWVLFLFLCPFQNIFVLIILHGAYGKMLNSKRFVSKRFLNQNSRTYIFSLKKNLIEFIAFHIKSQVMLIQLKKVTNKLDWKLKQ